MAFALINGENIDSWWWFLVCIRIGVTQMSGLWVISDRHLSIMTIMNDAHFGWFEPYAYHRVCMRHLASNFMTRFKNKILKKISNVDFILSMFDVWVSIMTFAIFVFEVKGLRERSNYSKLFVKHLINSLFWGKGLTVLNDLLNIWLTYRLILKIL